MRTDTRLDETAELVPGKILLLSVLTGCFTAIGGSLVIGLFFSISPVILVLGAIIQPYFRYAGKLVMGLGAVLLTSQTVILVFAVPAGIRLLHKYHDRGLVATTGFSILSVLLVTWCDIALVSTALKMQSK